MNTKYKILRLFITCLLVFLVASCEKDFLDKYPLDSPSVESFWKNKADVDAGLAGVYSRLQENFLGYERVYLEGLSDNVALYNVNWNQRYIYEMSTGSISPTTGTDPLHDAFIHMWVSPYRAITSCNLFLDNVDRAKDDLSLVPVLDEYKAEVRFIRALAYFDLVQLFGDVPIYTEYFKTLDEGNIAKSTKAEVYAQIEDDLDFAISTLPSEAYSGHAVKGSAQALLGRVLLTQEKWADAATVLKQIMDGGKFSLSESYKDIFLVDGQANPAVNCEIMFSTNYAPDDPQRLSPSPAGYNIAMAMWALLQPFKDFADSYEMTDGLPASESPLYDGTDSSTMYLNRDPRLDMSMKLPAETWRNPETGDVQDIQDPVYTGFVMEKYVDLNEIPITGGTAATTTQDYIHLRYADVLLMYAEAQNEAVGPGAAVYAALDEVRARADVNMPAVDQAKYGSQSTLRDYIRSERRVELAMEGIRYFDLKRWKTAEAELNGMATVGTAPMVFLPKHYYLPLPQTEIDKNLNLVQNPDY